MSLTGDSTVSILFSLFTSCCLVYCLYLVRSREGTHLLFVNKWLASLLVKPTKWQFEKKRTNKQHQKQLPAIKWHFTIANMRLFDDFLILNRWLVVFACINVTCVSALVFFWQVYYIVNQKVQHRFMHHNRETR